MALAKHEIIAQLQQDILQKEGFRPYANPRMNSVLGPMGSSFPGGALPVGVMHEFQSGTKAQTSCRASTVGFVMALASPLIQEGGIIGWVGASGIYPPGMTAYGVRPDQVMFIHIRKSRHALWATEEALKCGALAVVVAEVGGLDLTASRRLQLSAEQSQTTGFLISDDAHAVITSSATRWRVKPIVSHAIDDLPGVGFPRWRVELLRVRNGVPGAWSIQYSGGKFETVTGIAAGNEGMAGDDRIRRVG